MTTVKQIIENRPVYTIDEKATVQAAAEYMAHVNVGALPVVDGERLVGILSERDVIGRVIARGLAPAATNVTDVMTRDLVVAAASESNESCMKKMKQANCRHLPIVEGDRLLGLLSIRDLLLVQISEKDDNIQFLHEYLFHVPPGLERKYSK